ncbi:MAG: hypothetical protein HY817_00010 [Candidatus Abawacabacteria bacterium]|nr:hypothetical protein [Candidatus Abawacabacteria bacterium]
MSLKEGLPRRLEIHDIDIVDVGTLRKIRSPDDLSPYADRERLAAILDERKTDSGKAAIK